MNEPMQPGVDYEYVYTIEDHMRDERDRKLARMANILQITVACIGILFFIRGLTKS